MLTEISEVTILTEHNAKVGDENLVDIKELAISTANDHSKERSILIHTRRINEKEYIVKSIMRNQDKDTLEYNSMSDLSDVQIHEFLEEWKDKWRKRKIKDSEVKTATERVKKEAKKAKLIGEKMLKKKPKN